MAILAPGEIVPSTQSFALVRVSCVPRARLNSSDGMAVRRTTTSAASDAATSLPGFFHETKAVSSPAAASTAIAGRAGVR